MKQIPIFVVLKQDLDLRTIKIFRVSFLGRYFLEIEKNSILTALSRCYT